MRSLIYIVYAVLEYLLVTAFLLRLILPLARANMRNPLSQAVLRATNPLILPLRKLFPPIGRVDSASVVAVVLVQFVATAIVFALVRFALFPSFPIDGLTLFIESLLELLRETLRTYSFVLILYAVLSWVAPHTYSPVGEVLNSLCDPVLRRIRRIIPPLAGLDFSVFFACIAIVALLMALPQSPLPF